MCKVPVGAKDAVNDNFEYLDIDNQKARVDDKVQETSNGSGSHFTLSKSDPKHVCSSTRRVVRAIYIPS